MAIWFRGSLIPPIQIDEHRTILRWSSLILSIPFPHYFVPVSELFGIISKLFGNVSQLTFWGGVCIGLKRDPSQPGTFVRTYCKVHRVSVHDYYLGAHLFLRRLVNHMHIPTHFRTFSTRFRNSAGSSFVFFYISPSRSFCLGHWKPP